MFINLIFVIACVSHYCSHFVCVWHMCLNTLRIANLSVLFSALSIVYIHSTAVHLQPKVRLRHTLDLLRAVRELMPLSAVLMRAYAVDGHWAESVHLRMYTNLKPKSSPDKLTQFQRIVLTIH